MPDPTAGRTRPALITSTLLLIACISVAALSALALASSARADVDMTGGLEKVSSPITGKVGGVQPLATSANGTYRCSDEYSVVANWFYYFAIGNCRPGWELEVVSYASENSVTHEHSYGGFVSNAFSGCGWIDTRFPLEKLNSNSHSACAGGGSSREFKVEESTFMEKYNGATVGDGNPVTNPRPCPEYANYRPWSTNNVEKELIRTAPEYAASAPGSGYPALKWRYVTKYGSTDGSGKYVMARDDRITGAGEGNWVFVPLSCLKSKASELPENAEERNPPPPTATTGGFSNVTASSAVLAGSINPNGLDTHYYIEWGKEASKPYEGFAPQPYPGEDLGSGTGTLGRSVTATGLASNTTYYYRLVAKSPTGQSEGSTQSFKTTETVRTSKSAIFTKAGELLEFAGNSAGELIEYARKGGTWSRHSLTSEVALHPTISSSPSVIETPSGEIDVFARSGSNSLITFGLPSGGSWGAYNISGALSTPIVSENAPVMEGNTILVFAYNAAGEVMQFDRTSSGSWSVWNVTSLSNGHPTVSTVPNPVFTTTGELDVFARNASGNELIDFGRTTLGGWSAWNVTGETATYVSSEASPIMEGSKILVFAANPAGEVMQFVRPTSGAWSVWNITSLANGHPTVSSVPNPVFTPSGELDVLARNASNGSSELIDFGRTTLGAWSALNVSGETATDITSDADTLMEGSTIDAFARTTTGQVVQFDREPTGSWFAWNLGTMAGNL
jgi:hypothetical protein